MDLHTVLEHAADIQRTDADHPFVLEVPDTLMPVYADRGRLRQVLTTLLSNARKYTPPGGEIRLSARVDQAAVTVSVTDRGLGIPADAKPHLFERFYRVPGEQRRAIKGTGLGLAIVNDIVLAHGGQVGVESKGSDLGSRFWFSLPLVIAENASLRGTDSPMRPHHAGVAAPVTRRAILAVEDDEALGGALRSMLRVGGYAPTIAASAEDALQHLETTHFDAVVADLSLGGGMNGLELVGVVRQRWPETPFVLASGSLSIDVADAGRRGVSRVLGKPYAAAELLEALAEVLN
jgi:CheY-like chemotaxis protein